MRALIVGIVVLVAVGVQPSPAAETVAQVPVNSQKSLAAIVGPGFPDGAWEYPTGLVPRAFAGLTYVSGPGDAGLAPKAAWRKPLLWQSKAVTLAINCYRQQPAQPDRGAGGTPFVSLEEPDYRYEAQAFHGLPAAAAAASGRAAFVFRDGAVLFKLEASGGTAEERRQVAVATAEAMWKFRHPK